MPKPHSLPPIPTTTSSSWYLAVAGKVQGPFRDDQIVSALASGKLSAKTLACPDGGTVWKTINQWSTFVQVANSMTNRSERLLTLPPHPPSLPPDAPSPDSPKLTLMARVFCIYALFVCPALWLFSHVTCFASPLTYKNDSWESPIELVLFLGGDLGQVVVRSLMVVAALQVIRGRNSRNEGLLRATWALVVFTACYGFFVGIITMLLEAMSTPEARITESDAAAMLNGLIVICFLIEFIFLVVALFWMSLSKRLHVTSQP